MADFIIPIRYDFFFTLTAHFKNSGMISTFVWMRAISRPAEVAQLKQQSLDVLTLINGYLRYLRSRAATVREIDEADQQVLDALDALDL